MKTYENYTDPNQFYPIPGYEGYYEACANGVFRSIDRMVKCNKTETLIRGKVLKHSITEEGYLKVGLSVKNNVKNFKIHILLAKMFKPNPSPEKFRLVRHLNDIKTDNRLDNLEWGTDLDNIMDAVRNGTHRAPKGESHWTNGKKIDTSHMTEIAREKNKKIILNTETGVYYMGSIEAAESCGINTNTLRTKLTGHAKNNTPFVYV
jgi:hypothetical protein